MSGNLGTDYSYELTRTADRVLSGVDRESRQLDSKRKDKDFQDAESRGPKVIEAPSAKHGFHPVIQNAMMTFSSFVDTKFIEASHLPFSQPPR